MSRQKTLFSTAALLAASPAFSATVVPSDDANALVGSLLGPGITLVGTPTLTGATGAAGFFSDGLAAGVGIDEGILLTTGSAATATGPNDSSSAGTDNGQPGFTPLEAFNGGQDTEDATVLSFDFLSDGGDVFFNYVFASEEYNEFVDSSVNDVFAFILDGQNIARIPGSDSFVSIDTVNTGDNSSFFIDNEQDDDGNASLNLQYDGLTTVLTASATGLSAGEHTLTLAIADSGDSVFDSAVFLQGSTIANVPLPPVAPPTPPVDPAPPTPPTPPTAVPTPSAAAAGLLALGGLMARRRRR